MTDPDQETLWRNRFIAIQLVRIGGTIVVLAGLYISMTDAIQEGGATVPGLVLSLVGLAISFGGPKWLARKWRSPPGA